MAERKRGRPRIKDPVEQETSPMTEGVDTVLEDTTPPVRARRKTESEPDYTVTVGTRYHANGTHYTVPGPLYEWHLSLAPLSHTHLAHPTMPGPSFVPDVPGSYYLTLITTDGPLTLHILAVEEE